MKTNTPAPDSAGAACFARPVVRRSIALLLSVALLFMNACTVTNVQEVPPGSVSSTKHDKIVGVTLKDGTEVTFDPPGGTLTAVGINARVKSAPYHAPTADVQRVWLESTHFSAGRTTGLVGTLLVAGLVVAVATKQSCPFVYSWNGDRYVFDGEPYGGAITRGLERDDFSELENLRAVNGEYRLLVTNEVDETQHTNLMELWVVDHAPGTRIVSDERGNLRAFRAAQPPRAARDREGRDILDWLTATDKKIWEPRCVPGADGSLRQEVVLTFPKPAGATQVTLIANAATGMWGSYMIKKMTELRGSETRGFLQAIDDDPAVVQAVHAWGEREETYRLRVEVQEPDGWHVRGSIPGGGPYLAEDRAIALDVSRVVGNDIRLRLRPPVGFWALNSFALAAGAGDAVHVEKVALRSARTWDGKDVRPALSAVDDSYYAMPELSDRAELVFPAPARQPQTDRTVFLHSRGWYELHLRTDGPADQAAIAQISTVPDGAVRFAADYFAEWNRNPALRTK